MADQERHHHRSCLRCCRSTASPSTPPAPPAFIAAENRVELGDGSSLAYDYLVVATGPELAFDEIEGFGPEHNTNSICDVDHATHARTSRWEEFCKDPGPIVVGAVQGASCYGPAYEFAMIMDADLRKRRIRDKVPMTFVTAEPYIGHLGVGGVGDTKGLLESEMRQRHIKWITNAKVDKVEPGKVHATEVDDDGKPKKTHELPFKYLDDDAGLPRHRGAARHRGPGQSARLRHRRQASAQSEISQRVRRRRLHRHRAARADAAAGRRAEDRLHDRIHGDGDRAQYRRAAARRSGRRNEATWNAICLADFGDSGVAFVAMPQNPPRNVNWASSGRWVHVAKVAFEKYFLHKVRAGTTEPYYEKVVMKMLDIGKIKQPAA